MPSMFTCAQDLLRPKCVHCTRTCCEACCEIAQGCEQEPKEVLCQVRPIKMGAKRRQSAKTKTSPKPARCPSLFLDLPDTARVMVMQLLDAPAKLAVLRTNRSWCRSCLTEEGGLRVMFRMGVWTSSGLGSAEASTSLGRVLTTLAGCEPIQATVFLISGAGNHATAEEVLAGACINDDPTPRAVRHWRRCAGMGAKLPLAGLRRLVLQGLRVPHDILPPSLAQACPHLTNLMLDSCTVEPSTRPSSSSSRRSRSDPSATHVLPSLRFLCIRTARYEAKWSLSQLSPLLKRLPGLNTLCLGPFGTGLPEDAVAHLPSHITHLELDIRLAVHARQNWKWSERHVAALATNTHLTSLHLVGASIADRYSSAFAPTAIHLACSLTRLRVLQIPDQISDLELVALMQLPQLTSLAVGGFKELLTSYADEPCSLRQLQIGQQITFAQLARLPLANLTQPLRLDGCSLLPQHCASTLGLGQPLDDDLGPGAMGGPGEPGEYGEQGPGDGGAAVAQEVVAAEGMAHHAVMGGGAEAMLAEVKAAAANLARCGGAIAHDLTLQLATHPDWHEDGAVVWHDARVSQALQALLPNLNQVTGTLTLCSLVFGTQSVEALKLLGGAAVAAAAVGAGADQPPQPADGSGGATGAAGASGAGASGAAGSSGAGGSAAAGGSGVVGGSGIGGSVVADLGGMAGSGGMLPGMPGLLSGIPGAGMFAGLVASVSAMALASQDQGGGPGGVQGEGAGGALDGTGCTVTHLRSLTVERCFIGRGALGALRDVLMKGPLEGLSSLHLVENDIPDEEEVCNLCEGWDDHTLNPHRRALTIFLSQEDEYPSTQDIASSVYLRVDDDPGICMVETCDNGCHLRVELGPAVGGGNSDSEEAVVGAVASEGEV